MFFPQAREDLTIDSASEGGVLVFVPDSGRTFHLSEEYASLLLALDGDTAPQELHTSLSDAERQTALRQFYDAGLLANPVRRPTFRRDDALGTAVLLLPCRFLQRPGRSHLPDLYTQFLLRACLPTVVGTAFFFLLAPVTLPRLAGAPFWAMLAGFALAVLLHEFSHAVAACAEDVPTDGFVVGLICFHPAIAALFCLNDDPYSQTSLRIHLAGPFANLFCACLCLWLCAATQQSLLLYFAVESTFLGVLSLLPFPLFDGMALRLCFPRRLPPRAVPIAAAAALAVGWLLTFLPGVAGYLAALEFTVAAAFLLRRYGATASWRGLFGFCSVLPLVMHWLPWADYAVPPSNPIGWLLVVGLTSFVIGPLFLDLLFCRRRIQKN